MKLEQLLEEFGLTDKETQLYLFLLARGSASPAVISKMTNTPRSSAKYHADELVKKGFATCTKGSTTLTYTPVKPDKLFDLLERRREEANRLEHGLLNHMSSLVELFNPHGNVPKVTFFEGAESARELLFRMVDAPGDLVSFGAGDYFASKYPELVKNFRKKAYKEYRHIRVIRAEKYRKLHSNDPAHMQNRYFRTIDELTVDIQVREDKMSIISIDTGAPMGVLIEHADITNAFRKLFDELWNTLG